MNEKYNVTCKTVISNRKTWEEVNTHPRPSDGSGDGISVRLL